MLQTITSNKISWNLLSDVLKTKGFQEIGQEKWYVILQKQSKTIKIPKLNALPDILTTQKLEEAEISFDEFLKILRGDFHAQ